MPTLELAKASNTTFRPSYVPVAIFVGGTSGIGQSMAEAFAQYVGGKAHIIIIGRNERAAEEIISRFPASTGYTHEFLPCDLRLMANVRAVCVEIRQKVDRVNFLVLTAGYASMVTVPLTAEGLDLHLAMRFYQRFVFIKELLPLLQRAKSLNQDAQAMSVLGAGRGSPSRPIELHNLGNTVTARVGRLGVAMRGLIMSSNYTDAMMGYFASRNPTIAFTHIHPGIVSTPGMRNAVDFDGILTPITWILNWVLPWFAVSPAVCAEHMLYALLPNEETAQGGIFLRNHNGDVVSYRRFDEVVELGDSDATGVLDGTSLTGYGASDQAIHAVVTHTEKVTASSFDID
ncbi:hypothetical protein MIND_01348200 [Mycena indigotica]|uniref:NAD(P)-binding protein n=1 Tax=Mycena indigotica TaxID=2126181 RepID=A0A8H6RZA6_9AGAR|nr:uncharacterized protein MIND_01348200 [Mycena indigotica]KAF7289746.1 hypothetical protein MIND_01348200 [Mycena indigotica]